MQSAIALTPHQIGDFLLNVAVGGNWGGQHGVDDAAFPATMEVDYVRAYRLIEP